MPNQTSNPHAIAATTIDLHIGDAWPGIRGSGLTHKSPRGQQPLPKRVLLKCDLTDFRPMLAYEDDPLLAGGGGMASAPPAAAEGRWSIEPVDGTLSPEKPLRS